MTARDLLTAAAVGASVAVTARIVGEVVANRLRREDDKSELQLAAVPPLVDVQEFE